MQTGDQRLRILYVIWGFLECLGFGGLLYGWGSLVYVLKDEGFFQDFCHLSNFSSSDNFTGVNVSIIFNRSETYSSGLESADTEQKQPCSEADSKLQLAFTIAMVMFCVGCFIMGQINFSLGIRTTRLIASVAFIAGALLLAFMSKEIPYLLYPGLSLIGAGGITYLMTNMQLSNMFPIGGSAVVGLMCGGFDASSGIQLMIKMGYENGISRKTSYIILACTHLLTLISTFFFLPKDFIRKPTPKRLEEFGTDGDAAVELTDKATEAGEKEVKRSLISCMLSPIYILHLLWLSILQLRFYFFLGSLNRILESMLTKEEVSHYTNVFMYILMCGLFTSPFAGVVCDFFTRCFASDHSPSRRTLMPFVGPLALTTTLCILFSGLSLSTQPTSFYAVFISLLFFRSFMYTLGAGLIGAVFPGEYFGIMYGILILTGGIFSFLQFPLFIWAESAGFLQVNIFLFVLIAITYGHPLYLLLTYRSSQASASFSPVKTSVA